MRLLGPVGVGATEVPVPPLPTPRPCDGCTACCVVLDVPDLRKPAHIACSKLGAGGCTIYADRPPICEGFLCLWAVGDPLLPDQARPDRSGLLAFPGHSVGGLAIFVVELWEGAGEGPDVSRAVAVWRARFPVHWEDAAGARRFTLPGVTLAPG